MDAKLKKKWVRALRSGKYRQTKGSLKNKGGMCCPAAVRRGWLEQDLLRRVGRACRAAPLWAPRAQGHMAVHPRRQSARSEMGARSTAGGMDQHRSPARRTCRHGHRSTQQARSQGHAHRVPRSADLDRIRND